MFELLLSEYQPREDVVRHYSEAVGRLVYAELCAEAGDDNGLGIQRESVPF